MELVAEQDGGRRTPDAFTRHGGTFASSPLSVASDDADHRDSDVSSLSLDAISLCEDESRSPSHARSTSSFPRSQTSKGAESAGELLERLARLGRIGPSHSSPARLTATKRLSEPSVSVTQRLLSEPSVPPRLLSASATNSTDLVALTSKLEEYKTRCLDFERKFVNLQELFAGAETHRSELLGRISKLEQDLKDKNSALEKAQQVRVHQANAMRQLNQVISTKSGQLEVANTRLQDLTKTVNDERVQHLQDLISELDDTIGILEDSDSVKFRAQVDELIAARSSLVQRLRQQLMASVPAAEAKQTSALERDWTTREELLVRIESASVQNTRAKQIIDQIVAQVLELSEPVSNAILTGLSRLQVRSGSVDVSALADSEDSALEDLLTQLLVDHSLLEGYTSEILVLAFLTVTQGRGDCFECVFGLQMLSRVAEHAQEVLPLLARV
eukprot:m.453623 g.453623  ORF g.453623 m.453623 type:complete len:445 (-) comp56938_c0_seq3:121-1455(-)